MEKKNNKQKTFSHLLCKNKETELVSAFMLVTSPPKKVIKKLHVPQNSTSKKKLQLAPQKTSPHIANTHKNKKVIAT